MLWLKKYPKARPVSSGSDTDANRVFLIFGQPGSGKTYLAEHLRSNHSFHCLSLDDEYTDFVRTKCPALFFDSLRLYVAPHYEHILKERRYSVQLYGRDFVAEWYEHVLTRTLRLLEIHRDLTIEGYLLYDCADQIEPVIGKNSRVFRIHADKTTYHSLGRQLSLKEIARLGQEDS
jgi:hypothetical protein